VRRCSKCVMPSTWAGISFDKNGVCSLCQAYAEKKEIDWEERQITLLEILNYYRDYARIKGNKYNCLVGYSGGKDTAYTLWTMVNKYRMTPLVFTFDHTFKLSSEGEYNLVEIPRKLNCDHLRFSIGYNLRNALCKKASEVVGDFCWHCHNGVGAMPARISQQWDIPLQIWGEPTAEYQTTGHYKLSDLEQQDKKHFEDVFQGGITPKMVLPHRYYIEDLMPFTWPKGKFKLHALYLGNYEPWGQIQHVEIITKELGWKHRISETTYVDWDKVDCPFEDLREYQKYLRRGFGKVSFQASKHIRDGILTRNEAMKLVEKYEGKEPSTLKAQLTEIGMTKNEFDRITNRGI